MFRLFLCFVLLGVAVGCPSPLGDRNVQCDDVLDCICANRIEYRDCVNGLCLYTDRDLLVRGRRQESSADVDEVNKKR
ncbi:unnamed protein product, partial [Mesorhabditis spiculigera]